MEILDLLICGLKRLEYRGYDSAGIAIDGVKENSVAVIKKSGKVCALEDEIKKSFIFFIIF